MIEYARHAITFCEGVTEEAFAEDTKLQFAVVRALEVVGEAVRAIPEEARTLAPEVPWRQIVTTRNKIVHHYFGVRLHIIWSVVQNDLAPLIQSMERLLLQLDDPADSE